MTHRPSDDCRPWPAFDLSAFPRGATTRAIGRTGPAPTLAAIDAAVKELKAAMGPEPIGEWMREQGYPPESCLLVLPERMREAAGPFPPRYVRFSPHVTDPVLMWDLATPDLSEGWRPWL